MNFFLLFINIEELLSYKNIDKTLKLYDRLLDPHVAITTFFNSEKCIQFLKCEKCVDVPLIWNFLLSFLRSGKQSLCMTFPCFHNDISYCREVIIFPCLLWFILGFFFTFLVQAAGNIGKSYSGYGQIKLISFNILCISLVRITFLTRNAMYSLYFFGSCSSSCQVYFFSCFQLFLKFNFILNAVDYSPSFLI